MTTVTEHIQSFPLYLQYKGTYNPGVKYFSPH